jgi:hypothetical protein
MNGSGKGGASASQPTAPGMNYTMSNDSVGGGKGGSMAGGAGVGIGQPPMMGAGIGSNFVPPTNASSAAQTGQQGPMGTPTQNTMGPNAFQTGLDAQNGSMQFFQNQMNGGGSQAMNDLIAKMAAGGNAMPMGGGAGFSGPAYQMKVPGQDLYSYDPTMAEGQSWQAAQLKDQNINDYMNPYTQNVIDTTMGDLDMARQNAINSSGVAATRGGAFGGDRHGIMEAQNNNDYMQNVARTSAQLRNQGYQNAQNAAMSDVSSQNQALSSNAAMAQQANMANTAAQNARDQFVGQTANANQMAAETANLQSATQMAQSGGNNVQAMMQMKAQQQQAALAAMMKQQGMQFDAANQAYGMGQDRFNMGQNALDQMGQVGGQIDDLNQNLINQQIQMFMNQQNAPQSQFQNMLGPLSALSGGGTQSYSPGKMDYMGMGTQLGAAALMGSDMRLKDNIQKVATINGINLYNWDWNEEGQKAFPGQSTFGVLAQEVQETRPDAITENADGWLMVDYAKLPEVAKTVMMRA